MTRGAGRPGAVPSEHSEASATLRTGVWPKFKPALCGKQARRLARAFHLLSPHYTLFKSQF